jgi:hypothetical protein
MGAFGEVFVVQNRAPEELSRRMRGESPNGIQSPTETGTGREVP